MMSYRISTVLYRIAGIVLLAAAFTPLSPLYGDAGESGFTPDGPQISRLSIQGWMPRSQPVRAVRVSEASLSTEELQLYRMIMDYRRKNGLPSIPVSANLSSVARTHVRDLEAHPPSGGGNLHSWSGDGQWTPCRYYGSQSAEGMWGKPKELTDYPGRGYEIAAWTSSKMLPGKAFSLWIDQTLHNAVIINAGNWKRLQWNAVGVAISDYYAVVWFGEEHDISGE